MFYFEEGVGEAERQRVVGVRLRTQELTRQLVFVQNGKVVRNELLPTDFEKPLEGEIAFYVSSASRLSIAAREEHTKYWSNLERKIANVLRELTESAGESR